MAARAANPRPANPRPANPRDEIERLRSLVEDQHRRLRIYQSENDRADERGDVIDAFPSRCAKIRLQPVTLAGLIAEAEARLRLHEMALGAALRSHWFAARPNVPVLHPSPGMGAYGKAGAVMPNAVCSLFGRSAEEQRQVLGRIVQEQQSGRAFVPIFLTNDPDFTPLREAHMVFEYFPLLLDHGAEPPPAAWGAYFVDMIELTLRRWGVAAVLEL